MFLDKKGFQTMKCSYISLIALFLCHDVFAMDPSPVLPVRKATGLELFDKTVVTEAQSILNKWKYKDQVATRGMSLPHIVGIGGPSGSGKSFLFESIARELNLAPIKEDGVAVLNESTDIFGRTIISKLKIEIEGIFMGAHKKYAGKQSSIICLQNSELIMSPRFKIRELAMAWLKYETQYHSLCDHDVLLVLEFNNDRQDDIHFFNHACDQLIMLEAPTKLIRKSILEYHISRVCGTCEADVSADKYVERTEGFLPRALSKLAEIAAAAAIAKASEATLFMSVVTCKDFENALTIMGASDSDAHSKKNEMTSEVRFALYG